MEILGFIVLFTIIGFLIGIITLSQLSSNIGMIIIIAITVFWAFQYGWWAVATYIELMFGFFLANKVLVNRL